MRLSHCSLVWSSIPSSSMATGGTAATIQDENPASRLQATALQKPSGSVMIRAKPYTKATLTTDKQQDWNQHEPWVQARPAPDHSGNQRRMKASSMPMKAAIGGYRGGIPVTAPESTGVIAAVVAAGRGRTRNASVTRAGTSHETCPR